MTPKRLSKSDFPVIGRVGTSKANEDEMDETMIPDECKDGCTGLAILATKVDSLEVILKGNSHPGFIEKTMDFQQTAREFFVRHDATEEERENQRILRDKEIKESLEDHYRKQEKKQFWITVAISTIAIAVTLLVGLFAIPPAIQSIRDLLKSGDLHWPHIVKQETNPVYATKNPAQVSHY